MNKTITEAAGQLINDHYYLVKAVACQFKNAALSFDDLYDIAQEGLVNAAIKFDPSKGVPFSSYAWVVMINAAKKGLIRTSNKKESFLEKDALEEKILLLEEKKGKRGKNEVFFLKMEETEEINLIKKIIEEKSSSDYEIFLLKERYLGGEGKITSQAEIAKRFNLTQPKVSKMEKKAREKIRREMLAV